MSAIGPRVSTDRRAPVWIAVGVLLVAALLGVSGGVLDFELQVYLIVLLVPAVALVVDQRLGLLLFLMLMPYNGSLAVPRTAQNILFFGIALIFVLRLLLSRVAGERVALPVPRILAAYLVLYVVSMLIGTTHLKEISWAYIRMAGGLPIGLKEYVIGAFARQATLVVMAAIVVWLVVRKGGGRWIAYAALASGVLFVLMMLAVVATGGTSLGELGGSRTAFMILGRQSNALGGMFIVLTACALYMWDRSGGAARRTALLAVTAMLLGGTIMSVSRGALVALAVVYAFYVVDTKKARAALIGLVLIALSVLLAPESVTDRLLQGFDRRDAIARIDEGADPITSGRGNIWLNLAPEVVRSPLFGRGMASTQWSEFARTGGYWAFHPHNVYLELLMDVGLVGAIIVVLFVRYLWRLFRRLSAEPRLPPDLQGYFGGAAAGLLGFLVYGVSNGHWYPSEEQMYLWPAIGLAIGYAHVLGITVHADRSRGRAPLSRRGSFGTAFPRGAKR